MTVRISRLTIDMPVKTHKQIKQAASIMGVTMKELVIMSIDEFTQRKPNRITKRAIKESLEKKRLKKFDTVKQLFDDLGI